MLFTALCVLLLQAHALVLTMLMDNLARGRLLMIDKIDTHGAAWRQKIVLPYQRHEVLAGTVFMGVDFTAFR